MHTNQLIDMLASGVEPVDPHQGRRSVVRALAIGATLSLAATALLYGIQPGLGGAAHGAPFVMKAAYGATLALLSLIMAVALARPGVPPPSWRRLVLPIAALALLALFQLASTPASDWRTLLLGSTWTRCPLRIVALSLPVFAGLTIVTRRQAPTDLRRTGAAIGAVAGSTATIVYALACTENSAAFVLVWYTLGIAAAAAIGAALGPKLLRW